MLSYVATTRGITVAVHPVYLDEPSSFFDMRFAFGYAVHITNRTGTDVQLVRRRWTIQEASGQLQDIAGDEPLRAQPVIEPGQTHVYDGTCTIASFEGVVDGNFLVQGADGERFRVPIPQFPLQAAAN
ncbi:Co2+/Mg2+ efflux protein ApaG [Salisaeta longa]|uniref:Co2+/Mg2+ efflux protein ApaG n=1 Tax=Salisaeta longa TaxID=503170 RepID=UPI0003B6E85D|nr:Co2+/Mg2+ efflux protein ApaG [Salisaeta longa]